MKNCPKNEDKFIVYVSLFKRMKPDMPSIGHEKFFYSFGINLYFYIELLMHKFNIHVIPLDTVMDELHEVRKALT